MDTASSTWEAYIMSMEDQLLLQPSLDHPLQIWPPPKPNYSTYNLDDRPSAPLLPSPNLLGNLTKADVLGSDDKDDPEEEEEEEEEEELAAMKEMMFKIAAMQPVDIDPATVRRPRRRNVRISEDPQSVAARHRRERISEKIRILQRLVPGGTKMDTASMLDEAIRYVKFLKRQVRILQRGSRLQPAAGDAGTTSTAPPYLFNDINDQYYPMCFNRNLV